MRREVHGFAIATTGVVLAAVQVVHASARPSTTVGFVVDAVPFALMGIAVAYAGVWTVRHEEYGEYVGVVGAWTAGGALGFAAVAALVLFSMNVAVDFPVLESAAYLAMDNVTAGALAGALVGLYDARSRRRLADLRRQRDRVESFANRAADMNTYGRALNECATRDEIGALCVEAMVTLLELRDVALLERREGAVEPIESTVVGVDEAVLADLADRSADADPATVHTHAVDLPAGLPDDVESVLTVLVTERVESSVVIVALDRGERPLADETTDLLEMLVSHAGTALENVSADSRVGVESDAGPGPDADPEP